MRTSLFKLGLTFCTEKKMQTKQLPHFIFEEILSYLGAEEQFELITLNQHSYKTLVIYAKRNLRLSRPLPESFYRDILPEFGGKVQSLEIGFFDTEAIQALPNIKKIKVLAPFCEDLEDEIEEILTQYPSLTELDLSAMSLGMEMVPLVCGLKKLNSLKLPDLFTNRHRARSFLNQLTIPSLRSLALEFRKLNKEVLQKISKNLPNLVQLEITAKRISDLDEDIFNAEFRNLKELKILARINTLSEDAMSFNLVNFPQLRNLGVSSLIKIENPRAQPCPSIEGFMPFYLGKELHSSLLEHFAWFSSLVLNCQDISPQTIRDLLPMLNNMKSLEFHRVQDSSVFEDLPYVEYNAHSFSLISSYPVRPELFFWISSCYDRLHTLVVEFDPSCSTPCDLTPLELGGLFHSLAKFQVGGSFPASWIRQMISHSPNLDILGLDSDIYIKHSLRFAKQYPFLSFVQLSKSHSLKKLNTDDDNSDGSDSSDDSDPDEESETESEPVSEHELGNDLEEGSNRNSEPDSDFE